MNKEIKIKRKINPHGKPGDVSAKLNFNSDSKFDPLDGDDTEYSIKNSDFDGEMTSLNRTTNQFIQKLHFHRKILKFVIGCIPNFDTKIAAMKNKIDETPSNPR